MAAHSHLKIRTLMLSKVALIRKLGTTLRLKTQSRFPAVMDAVLTEVQHPLYWSAERLYLGSIR